MGNRRCKYLTYTNTHVIEDGKRGANCLVDFSFNISQDLVINIYLI